MPDEDASLRRRLERIEHKIDDVSKEIHAHESELRAREIMLANIATTLTDNATLLKEHDKRSSKLAEEAIPELKLSILELKTRQNVLSGVFGTLGGIAASMLVKLGIRL